MAYSKVGFLASGAGGNPTGIGGYVHALNNEGIPAVAFCNDGVVGIADAIASGGNHVLLYRVVKDGSEQWSVPDYSLPPANAALKHWNKLRPQFHPDFVTHKSKIWWQPINEVDKERSDWLGRFAVELAVLANANGFKVAMFAFSSGEPEPGHWRTAGMVSYLNYCATHKEMAAVALHEYDYGQAGMSNVYPWHIGRFQELYKACDETGIKRPYVLISEFGWSYDSIPAVDKCLEDIDFAAELYAKYADVLGATIWYLGPGFGNIANAVQKLIIPVTNYTINAEFPEPEEPGEPPMPTLNETLWNASQTEWAAQRVLPGYIQYPLVLGSWQEQMRNVKRVPAHNEKSLVFDTVTYSYQGFFDPYGELPYVVQAWSSKSGHFVVKEPAGGAVPPDPFLDTIVQ